MKPLFLGRTRFSKLLQTLAELRGAVDEEI
jgi:hypothetical protein